MSWSTRGLQRLAAAGAIVIEPVIQNGFVVDAAGVARPCDDILHKWEAVLQAPTDTAFQHEVFKVELTVPAENAGMVPPQVRLVGRIPPHPNIHPTTGTVAMDILADKWSPAWGLPQVLLCVRVLLGAPNFDDFCFATAFRKDVKASMIVHRICLQKHGLFYLWLRTQEPFIFLPDVVLDIVQHLLLAEIPTVGLTSLAAAASVPIEMLRAACTLEEKQYGNARALSRARVAALGAR